MPELNKVTPAKGPGLTYKKLSDMEPGDRIEGILVKRWKNEKFGQNVYKIFTTGLEMIGMNGNWQLDNFMEVIADGAWVAIDYIGPKKTGTVTDPETGEKRDKIVQQCNVQEATDDDEVRQLRALAEQAEKEEEAAKEKENEEANVESIFASEAVPF